jgi:hypothetical protein
MLECVYSVLSTSTGTAVSNQVLIVAYYCRHTLYANVNVERNCQVVISVSLFCHNLMALTFVHSQERLYKEIKSVVGDRIVTEDDLDQMPFLNACIQETLRVYTALPLLPPRRVSEDITLGGYDIPKGSNVSLLFP